MEAGEIREGADGVAARLVVEDGGSNENPIETAVPDDRLLPVLVGVYVAQEKRKDQIVKKKAAVASTVTGADARDAHQASDLLGLHRAHERARRGGEQCDLAEWAGCCAECTDYGIAAFESLAQRRFIAGVTYDELRALETTPLPGRTHQRGDVVTPRQRLTDDKTAGAAGCAKDQYFRRSRADVVSGEVVHDYWLVTDDAIRQKPPRFLERNAPPKNCAFRQWADRLYF